MLEEVGDVGRARSQETWGPLKDFNYHYLLSWPTPSTSLLSDSVCLGMFLTEPLHGALNWKVSANCPKTLISGPQKYLHDMNEIVKTDIVSGPSPKAQFQMPAIKKEGYPLEFFL